MAGTHRTLPRLTSKQVSRFWSKVQKGQPHESAFWLGCPKGDCPNDCWPWVGCRSDDGYGRVRLAGHNRYAPRIAYLIHYGRFAEHLYVLHTCDNPACCNPKHLWLGTALENAQDRDYKGRGVLPIPPIERPSGEAHYLRKNPERALRGEAHGGSKLTTDQVRAIRQEVALGLSTQRALSRKYQLSPSQVCRIIKRTSWEHIS